MVETESQFVNMDIEREICIIDCCKLFRKQTLLFNQEKNKKGFIKYHKAV